MLTDINCMKTTMPRTCAGVDCDVDISHRNRDCVYCSRPCRKRSKRARPPLNCERCQTPLQSRHGNVKFCSRECAEPLELRRAYHAEWRAANPTRARSYGADRRARKLAQFVEHVDRGQVWNRDNGVCHICGTAADPLNWHLEHIIPLSRGGEHSYANTAVSHPACNLAKGARLP